MGEGKGGKQGEGGRGRRGGGEQTSATCLWSRCTHRWITRSDDMTNTKIHSYGFVCTCVCLVLFPFYFIWTMSVYALGLELIYCNCLIDRKL